MRDGGDLSVMNGNPVTVTNRIPFDLLDWHIELLRGIDGIHLRTKKAFGLLPIEVDQSSLPKRSIPMDYHGYHG